MSNASLQVAGILFIALPTVAWGGYSLFRFLTKQAPGYLDNPVRRGLFTAGHAHAGVWIVLALVDMRYVDDADLSGSMKNLVRATLAIAPILMPAGFFLSMVSPKATEPNRLIYLAYAGAVSLMIGAVILGVGLIRAS